MVAGLKTGTQQPAPLGPRRRRAAKAASPGLAPQGDGGQRGGRPVAFCPTTNLPPHPPYKNGRKACLMSGSLPLVPALLALALRPLPLAPLNRLLSGMLGAVMRDHPEIGARLGEHADKRFGLEPVDLPFSFVLEPRPEAPRLVAVRDLRKLKLDARITGSLAAFLGLAQATLDGDSLFFSRALTIEGDVAAALALRNALDDAGIDLISVAAACLRPLGPSLERMAARASAQIAPLLRARLWS